MFNYRKKFAKAGSASFYYTKHFEEFGRSVEIWCDFPNVAALGPSRFTSWTVFNAARLHIQSFQSLSSIKLTQSLLRISQKRVKVEKKT
jgi:hypothetical protein